MAEYGNTVGSGTAAAGGAVGGGGGGGFDLGAAIEGGLGALAELPIELVAIVAVGVIVFGMVASFAR